MSDEMFKPLAGAVKTKSGTRQDDWVQVVPVPDDSPPPPAGHPSRGRPAMAFRYLDATGALLGLICRFAEPDGGKVYLPLSFCRNAAGKVEWRWKGFADPRPLYGLDRLAAKPDSPVLVVEGEKAADAAQRLLPDWVAMTSPGGSKAATKTDWQPLAGRYVTIWPDADQPGEAYASAVEKALLSVGAVSVRVIAPPANVAEGWDIADAEAEGWDSTKTAEFVRQAQPRTRPDNHAEKPKDTGGETDEQPKAGRRRVADDLVDLAGDAELWHTPDGEAYATIPVGTHFENYKVKSKAFRNWLAGLFYDKNARSIGKNSIDDALCVLELRAMRGGEHRAWLRSAQADDGSIWIDLGDKDWRGIHVSPSGWKVKDTTPVKFYRPKAMRPLPVPEMAENLDDLRALINVKNEDDFKLVGAWLVAAFRPTGPYPILCLNGEAGSSKSTLSKLLRSLVDPNVAPNRAAPREDRDLPVLASKSWALVMDNLSHVPEWLSDSLCRLATGGGMSSRTLYQDDEENIFEGQRPIILNGIPGDLAARSDLASRCLVITLKAISEDQRRTEADFWADFECKAPLILGALLDGVAGGLKRLPEIKPVTVSRMADFATWATAAEYALGWNEGDFLAAYKASEARAVEAVIDANLFITAVVTLLADRDFTGTATGLLSALEDYSEHSVRNNGKLWPAPNKAREWLRRATDPLRKSGISLDLDSKGSDRNRTRLISIKMLGRA